MPDFLARMGLTDEEDVADLIRLRKAQKVQRCDVYLKNVDGKMVINKNSNDFIDVDDNQTQLKALEMTLKLKSKFPKDKVEVSGNITMTPEQLAKGKEILTKIVNRKAKEAMEDAKNGGER